MNVNIKDKYRMRFREFYLREDEVDGVHPPSTPQQFRTWLTKELSSQGITTTKTGAGRHGFHIRFPLEGTFEDFQNFFSEAGIEVRDTDVSMTGTFATYELVLVKSNDVLVAPVSMFWVNNITGTKDSDKKFNAKDLTPDDLGMAGKTFTDVEEIADVIRPIIHERYPQHNKLLGQLLRKTEAAQSTVVDISDIDLSDYTTSDLATISKNYGEILCGVWSFENLNYDSVFYPAVSNAALIDYYGSIDGVEQPVSVKSGGGGKVTINNILEALEDKVKAGKINPAEEESYVVFDTVRINDMRNGFIELHKHFDTPGINKLSEITDIPVDEISVDTLQVWFDDYDIDDLKKMYKPFLETLGTKVTDAIWKRGDKLRVTVSPLGEVMPKFLNNNTEIRESMSTLANNLQMVQVNIDVKKKTLIYQVNNFGEAEFIFGWAGYAGGNKLGFKMKL